MALGAIPALLRGDAFTHFVPCPHFCHLSDSCPHHGSATCPLGPSPALHFHPGQTPRPRRQFLQCSRGALPLL